MIHLLTLRNSSLSVGIFSLSKRLGKKKKCYEDTC